MRAYQASYSVSVMAKVFGVSTSGYYDWRNRGPSQTEQSNAALLTEIAEVFDEAKGRYGAPRVWAELRARGHSVGRNRVAFLMRKAGLFGKCGRRKFQTTVRDGARPAPDLVERVFEAGAPDKLWVADITYVPSRQGFFYLAVVMDVFSRRIVGWSMQDHLRTELILAALDMAIAQRRPESVVHHSDQGCQYTSLAFGHRCRENNVRPSMGSVGDCYDNAMAESFFATLERELLADVSFLTKEDGKREVFEFIEGWYNNKRRHSSIDNLCPVEYEIIKAKKQAFS